MSSGQPLRIVVVSALYPPDFVGGATVQAQRLARAFDRRGHDVRVFAGSRDPSRPPGASWDETDGTGLRVRWLATQSWLEFADEYNHANPVAEEAFERMLTEEPADVVHLHALQGLGGGLVTVAASVGARVIVTMHDLWWFCARQFLADRNHMPCCPVVEAGVCPCEMDRPWLQARIRTLSSHLERADLVLAPSRAAAASLRANGVPARLLEVDENGLPELVVRSADGRNGTPSDGPVRFLYVGGGYEMKGVRPLFDAARLLGDLTGWELIAYGVRQWVRDNMVDVRELPVRMEDPFGPEEADEVYSRGDILVIPSVMTETYSLVTREALGRGLPVICTDSLGPEEVVFHGRNGLVVPAGDPASLAEAMRSVVTDPSLLHRLRSATGSVGIRTLESQADGLEDRYRRLVKAPARQQDPAGIEHVLFVSGIEGAPLRYRAWLPAEALGLCGVRCDVRAHTDPEVMELATRADAVVVYRVPATPAILEMIARVRERGAPVLFDVDDLIFEPGLEDGISALRSLPPDERRLWMEGVRRYRTTLQSCDAFIGSTQALCEHAERIGMPADRFANGVGLRASRLSDAALYRPRTPGPPRVAYLSGTTTHDDDWLHAEPGVMQALRAVRDAELWLIGHVPETDATRSLGPRLKRVPFTHWERLPSLLRDVDVNLAPLAPGFVFNEAKSAIKWLEAALVSTPTIASPTQPFREAIEDGTTGVLADGPDEFAVHLERLLTDQRTRTRMGRAARRRVLFDLTPRIQAERYVSILRRAADRARSGTPPRPERIEEEIRDEPARPVALEPYPLALAAPPATPTAPGPPLEPGRPREWTLSVPADGLSRLDLFTATFGGRGSDLHVRLLDGSTRTELASCGVRAVRVVDGGWTAAETGPLPSSPRSLVLEVEAMPGPKTSLWMDASGAPVVRSWREPDYGVEPPAAHPGAGGRPLGAKVRLAVYLVRSEGPAALARHAGRAVRRLLLRGRA